MDLLNRINCSYIHGHDALPAAEAVLHPNYFPATNQIINQSAYASDENLLEAVHSSQQAFAVWSTLPINQRSNVLLQAAKLLRTRVKELAALEVWDTGKPISEALTADVMAAADCLEYFAKAALGIEDTVIPHQNALIYSIREPLGVCVGIGAWNYPLQIACWKAAPALIMGNTMIYKPSELTPMTTLKLARIFIEAGLPYGAFNVILGDGHVAEKLINVPGIAKVSFTGSVPTGKKILQQTAEHLIPVTLELGGKSPLIIFDDANLDQAVTGSMLANFYTQGEICSNGTRVFVQRQCYQQFMDMLLMRIRKIVIGDPFDEQTQMGALISPAHLNKVADYIKQGIDQGATLAYGGKLLSLKHKVQPATTADEQPPLEFMLHKGNFLEPTIFTDCRDDMTIVKEEIFGPVMTVLVFDKEDEVIARANNTTYGLAAGIFTEQLKRAHRVARQLQAGICWVNNNVTPASLPFGGYKSSGMGRENGLVTLTQYTQQKSIYVELNEIEHSYQ